MQDEKKTEEEIAQMIQATNFITDPAKIETHMLQIEAEMAKHGKIIELFHKDVVILRNERCVDDALLTAEGTKKSLKELQVHAAKIENIFKVCRINQDRDAKHLYCWSI